MARCDDGYDAIGGGFDKHREGGGTFGMRPTTSRPSVPSMDEGTRPGEGWVAVFHRERGGPAGVEVSAYVVCAPREDVPEPGVYLAQEEKTIPPTYIQTYTPRCRGDDWAIGGGYDFFGDDYVALVRSQHNPGDKLHSWLLAATTDHRFKSVKVKAYAVCVPKEFLRELHVREAADTSGAGSGNPFAEATTPKCPNGTYLPGGGAGMPNRDAAGTGGVGLPDLIRISPGKGPRENPPWKPETWQAKVMKNSSLFPLRITIHAFAMCGELSDQRADGKLSGKNPGWGDGMGGGRFK